MWYWQVLIQGSRDDTYDFHSTEGFKTRKKCMRSLHIFMREGQLFNLLMDEGEENPSELAVIDTLIECRRD